MRIHNFQALDLDAVPQGDSGTYAYQATLRSRKRVYLYNRAMELSRILDLEDYGILDKRKMARYGEREFEVDDGPKKRLALSLADKLVLVWHEELGLELYHFDGERRFALPGPYVWAAFDSRKNVLWAARRQGKNHMALLVLDHGGSTLACLEMDDPLGQSMVLFEPLPQPNAMAASFGGGQDGSQDYFVSWRPGSLTVDRILPQDLTYLYHFRDGTRAILMDFYQETLFHSTYPDLQKQAQFTCPQEEELTLGQILLLDDQRLIFCNGTDQRYYLFHTDTMTLGEEITIAGHAPLPDPTLDGHLCTEINQMNLQDDKLFVHFSKGFGTRQREWVLVLDKTQLDPTQP